MVYVPDANDATHPTDAEIAETAAAEFRALKTKMNTFASGAIVGGGFQNILTNGNFLIAQDHGTSNLPAFNGGYVVDEWRLEKGIPANPFDVHLIVNDPVNNPPGYQSHLDLTVSAPYNPVNAGDFSQFCTAIEAAAFPHLDMGSAEAQTSTILFWVKSSITGNYSVSLRNLINPPLAVTRSFVHSFNIPVANVWQRIAVPVPGDVLANSWPIVAVTDPGAELCFVLGAGVNFRTNTVDAWQAGNVLQHTGDVQFTNQIVGAKLSIGGVEWKAGVWLVSTPAERIPVEAQFTRAARYFIKSAFLIPVSPAFATYSFPTAMRTVPVITADIPNVVGVGASALMGQFTQTVGVNAAGNVTFNARML